MVLNNIKYIKIIVLLLNIMVIFFFNGCALNQKSSLTWEEMFDNKDFIPVNKEQNLINVKKAM